LNIKLIDMLCCSSPLYNNLVEALIELGLHEANLEKVTDPLYVLEHTNNKPPALYINDELKSMGKYLEKNEVLDILKEYV